MNHYLSANTLTIAAIVLNPINCKEDTLTIPLVHTTTKIEHIARIKIAWVNKILEEDAAPVADKKRYIFAFGGTISLDGESKGHVFVATYESDPKILQGNCTFLVSEGFAMSYCKSGGIPAFFFWRKKSHECVRFFYWLNSILITFLPSSWKISFLWRKA